jgi:phage/plasmid-associated DNA primase
MMSTNNHPPINDRSNGIWRRMLFLPFRVAIPESEQDPQLAQKLKGEIAGILNWALEGRKKLYTRGSFILPRVSEEALQEYRRESNPAEVFLREEVRIDSSARTSVEAVYVLSRVGQAPRPLGLEQRAAWARSQAHVRKAVHKMRPAADGARVWMYQGIALSNADVVEEVAA